MQWCEDGGEHGFLASLLGHELYCDELETLTLLPTPEPGRSAAEEFVGRHLAHLICDEPLSASSIDGGQRAADAALAAFDVAGYASDRNQVYPTDERGVSRLSPYIRHGLLTLRLVWDRIEGPEKDVAKFRDELLWQEYARHLYARLGPRTRSALRSEPAERTPLNRPAISVDEAWRSTLPCVSANVDELIASGWLVNQARMWLSSHWTVRHMRPWTEGEDFFFRHLLDGSRAANRLGWQWTTGAGSHKSYGFSRWQVEKRAPGWCQACELSDRCPIESKPHDYPRRRISKPSALASDPDLDRTSGAYAVTSSQEARAAVNAGAPAEVVWLTAESLGHHDPALSAYPDLPVIFVFDEPLLDRLQLSGKRLVFLVETLAELAEVRDVELHLGCPPEVLADRTPSVTFAPVPGFRRHLAALHTAVVHPWPWLVPPHAGSIQSFSAWRRGVNP